MQQQKLRKLMDELNEEGDGRSAPVVKLGNASMASPFTAKHASASPTTDIIRQGRSTLVTTLQMFKILGLNCLATANVLNAMNLDGVKLGDFKATVNMVSYVVSMMIQVVTFAVNYVGHPFNQSVLENKPFFYALLAAVGFFTAITYDVFRDFDD